MFEVFLDFFYFLIDKDDGGARNHQQTAIRWHIAVAAQIQSIVANVVLLEELCESGITKSLLITLGTMFCISLQKISFQRPKSGDDLQR